MAEFSMTWKRLDQPAEVVVIRLTGAVDYVDQRQVEATFDDMLTKEQPRHVLIDFQEVTFVVTPFIGSLLFWREKLAARGGSLILFSLRRGMAAAIEHLHLQRVLTIRNDQDTALAGLSGS